MDGKVARVSGRSRGFGRVSAAHHAPIGASYAVTYSAAEPVGTLVSVNVGKPKDVPWRGRTVHTGVWKYPVAGPSVVRRLNIDGDGQGDLAGHGGEQRAVLVYQLDSYRFWRRELGRDDVGYGQFGENFTVDGLPDDEVCIGDRYRIGDALFEVTQPRVTCYRVGIRMDEPRLPALLVARHRPGFYLRVLAEGTVRPGDEITRVATGPERMTVADIDALLYLPGHTRSRLVRALRIPALSAGWRGSFQSMLDQIDGGTAGSGNAGLTTAAGPPPAWPGFRRLTITAVIRESDSVRSLRLADPSGGVLPAAAPGQFLTLRLRPEPDRPVLRSYSLSGPPGAADYRISVKLEPFGVAGRWLHSSIAVGDRVDVAAPRGSFTLRPGRSPVLLVSAGVGATPMLAMLHTLAAGPPRQVWWLYGARNSGDHPFAAESDALLARLPDGHRHVAYSRPGPDDHLGRQYDTAGRLTAALLADLAPPRDAEAYLCGPAGFMREMSAGLVALGFDPARLHTEIFGAEPPITPGVAAAPARRPHQPAGRPGAGPPVAFARSGLTVPWDDACGSLLEFAETCDVPVRWSCRTGVCHTCETRLISGRVDYQPEPVEAPANGNVLVCCAQPRDEVVLDL
ncbi:MAG: MOSC domain-containing protein [Gaiellaceae bacterium]